MTAIYIRAIDTTLWHRLTIVGHERHGTACMLGSIPVASPIALSSDPPIDDRCPACTRDERIRVSRVSTVNLRPRMRDGRQVDVAVTKRMGTREPSNTAWASEDAAMDGEWDESVGVR